MDIDIKNIEKLLEEKKYDEVRNIVNGVASSKLSDKETGAVLTGVASVYLEVSNAINERYKEVLKQAIEGMKKINNAENKSLEKIKLSEIRDSLSK